MRLKSTLFFLLLLAGSADAQKLTGIWRGYFTSTDAGGIYRNGMKEETYKYEVQIDQQSNDGVKGVTYSYKTTVFYGKAELQGIFTGSSRSVVFKETRLVDLKIGDKSEPCLMTCYLDYSKIGKLEVLEGTFISINTKDKSDCGSGKVYLERVPTSDFQLEDFLVRKKSNDTNKTSGKINVSPGASTATTQKRTAPGKVPSSKPATVLPSPNSKTGKDNLTAKPLVKPQPNNTLRPPVARSTPSTGNKPAGSKPNATAKTTPALKDNKTTTAPAATSPAKSAAAETAMEPRKTEETVNRSTDMEMQQAPLPKVLLERENKLERVFTTAEEDLEIAFYDNGEIDNDTISVYHNNKLVVSNGRLTLKPIVVHIKSSKTNTHHELIVVAENLGEIPPNTTLLVISPNSKERKEIILTSTDRRNAKVVINYVPKQ